MKIWHCMANGRINNACTALVAGIGDNPYPLRAIGWQVTADGQTHCPRHWPDHDRPASVQAATAQADEWSEIFQAHEDGNAVAAADWPAADPDEQPTGDTGIEGWPPPRRPVTYRPLVDPDHVALIGPTGRGKAAMAKAVEDLKPGEFMWLNPNRADRSVAYGNPAGNPADSCCCMRTEAWPVCCPACHASRHDISFGFIVVDSGGNPVNVHNTPEDAVAIAQATYGRVLAAPVVADFRHSSLADLVDEFAELPAVGVAAAPEGSLAGPLLPTDYRPPPLDTDAPTDGQVWTSTSRDGTAA